VKRLLNAAARRFGYEISRVKASARENHATTVARLAAQGGHSRLSGKVAIVTGAATGIGRATAELFAREGAAVVMADVNDEEGLDAERQIAADGGDAVFVHTDVANDSDVEGMVATAAERYGRLDILVNNAGILLTGAVVDTAPADWQRVLDVNLGSVFRTCRLAIPLMLENEGGGSIVNTSSIQALTGFQYSCAYAASKGGIVSLTRQVSRDYAASRVRVNCICPGIILTTIYGSALETPEDRRALLDTWDGYHPIGHFGLPEDVAYAALYLASDESSFVTGTTLTVDGGLTSTGV
jgi:NAD(P)-dependent dehydrogenase (short-subunit alcohol dehydrogenase family)